MLGMQGENNVTFHKGEGCPECRHSGYSGRRAVFEIFMINGALRRMISDGASFDELTAAALKNGMKTMRQSCRELVLRGVTTAAEAARTIISTVDD